VQKQFTESFILYTPKDIVAGDFYRMYEEENIDETDERENAGMNYNPVLIAAADCTGHGVPGAFMSLLGKENLDKSLNVSASPGGILSELNRNIKRALQQNKKEDATRDGMDIALIKKQGNKVWYSGANRPLWIKRKSSSEIEEVKATKTAIGGFTDDSQEYTEHEFDLESGDMLYMFTDGYADQFGGEKEKKLTTKRFKEILLSICDKAASEQKQYLGDFMKDWKKHTEQVDDILVIGIRI
jgi:serine phosphatase RsbU (regulator of sigma subunit)